VKSAAARGREFEAEVANFLCSAGFEVTPNAKIAKPRQTDLFAKGDNLNLLIETKNQKRHVDIDNIDALRSRLGRTTSDVVGVIFTTSGLTRGAIEEIKNDRTRLVLAFVKEEIEHLRAGSHNLRTLIDRKHEELRIHGRVWFGTEIHSEFVGVKLPRSNVEFRIGSAVSSFFESRSGFAGAFFSLQIPDSGWGTAAGEGARLPIRLALNNAKDLRNIVGYLHRKFGLTSNGMFSIQQSGSCWHGVGAENFLQAVEQWRERYAQSPSKIFHHSEGFIYFDQFRDGWIELSAQQRIDWKLSESFFLHSELVIQLPGVPVDTAPFLDLCRYTSNDWAHFEYIGERWTSRIRLKKPVTLGVIGKIVSREHFPSADPSRERFVIGVIARNPFYRSKSLPNELLKSDISPLHELKETELIISSLKDWYEDGDVVDHYVLQGVDVTVGSVGQVIRPFGTWNQIVKRARANSMRRV
jgi:Restriction endonuclease